MQYVSRETMVDFHTRGAIFLTPVARLPVYLRALWESLGHRLQPVYGSSKRGSSFGVEVAFGSHRRSLRANLRRHVFVLPTPYDRI